MADQSNHRIQVFENVGDSFKAILKPASDGLVTVDLPAGAVTDASGNKNTAAEQFRIYYDGSAPFLSISSDDKIATNKESLLISFTFSEKVSGFTKDDITVKNGTLSDLQTNDDITFTASLSPAVEGMVTIWVSEGAAADATGNNSNEAHYSILYDITPPIVVISSLEPSLTNNQTFVVYFSFNEKVSSFSIEGVTVSNGTAANLKNDHNKTFSVEITAKKGGKVTVDFAADNVTDAAGNGNTAADQFTITFDLPPVITAAQTFSIIEKSPAGTVVGTVTATDVTEGTIFNNWTIESGNTGDAFAINSHTGELTVYSAEALDGITKTFTLSIAVSDGTHSSEIEEVTVKVIPGNNAPTDVVLSSSSVEEHKPAGTLVGTFSTVDLDVDDVHTYNLTNGEGSAGNSFFYIEGNKLLTKTHFDYEIQSEYTIRVVSTDNKGAAIEKVFTIQIKDVEGGRVFIPNLFSPNGDGSNDVFRVRANAIQQITFRVFNRWGEMMFETSDIHEATEKGWDGKYKGKDQPSGTYVWQIMGKFTDGTPISFGGKNTGNISLIR